MQIFLEEDLCRFDSTMIPSSWNDSKYRHYSSKKLKFGYYYDDGVSIASPPVERAILKTATALKAQGHEVVAITPPNVAEAVRIFVGITSSEGYAFFRPAPRLI